NPPSASTGVYRSQDGGVSWTRISAGSGLPNGAAADLVADPANNQRFYVNLLNQGIWRTDDAGLHWTFVLVGFGGETRLSVHFNSTTGTDVLYASGSLTVTG